MSKGWKFEYSKAMKEVGLTPAYIATLQVIWDSADNNTGKSFISRAYINDKCGRSKDAKVMFYLERWRDLGFLTWTKRGRGYEWCLNTDVKTLKQSIEEVSNVSTPEVSNVSNVSTPEVSNVSNTTGNLSNTTDDVSNTTVNLSNLYSLSDTDSFSESYQRENNHQEERTPKSRKKKILQGMVDQKKGIVPSDWIPSQQDSDNYPALLLEAKTRYNFLVSLGLKPDVPFEDKQIERLLVDWSSNKDPVWELCVLLMGNRQRISQLKGLSDWKLQKAGEDMKFGELGAREEEWGFQLVERLFNKPRYKIDRPEFPSLMKFRDWCSVPS